MSRSRLDFPISSIGNISEYRISSIRNMKPLVLYTTTAVGPEMQSRPTCEINIKIINMWTGVRYLI